MLVNLNDLPKNVYNNLPLTIRTLKNEYELNDLPMHIQHEIKQYFNESSYGIQYKRGFDVYPKISNQSDLEIIDNLPNLIIERLRSFLLTNVNDYPFNANLGSQLKWYLQTKDTSTRELLIGNEVENIISVLQSDLNQKIEVVDKQISSEEKLNYVYYSITIVLKINDIIKKLAFVV